MKSWAFQSGIIKSMTLKNRFIRSATFEGMANFEGKPTQKLKELYYNLADGQVGLIVTGLTHVDGYKNLPNIEGLPFPLEMDEDRFIDDWTEIIEGVHRRGAKIAMQLIHLGRQDIPQFREPVAPSAVRLRNSGPVPRELTVEEIEALIEKFAQSCRRVKEAGFDAVQLHGGHGFLISNFISPYFNIRNDRYGGSTENRARFIVDIIEKARISVGTDHCSTTQLRRMQLKRRNNGRNFWRLSLWSSSLRDHWRFAWCRELSLFQMPTLSRQFWGVYERQGREFNFCRARWFEVVPLSN